MQTERGLVQCMCQPLFIIVKGRFLQNTKPGQRNLQTEKKDWQEKIDEKNIDSGHSRGCIVQL